jgi:hypothetical protein
MALDSGEVDEPEFYRLRSMHLKQAEDFLHKIHETYSTNDKFNLLQNKLERLNALA